MAEKEQYQYLIGQTQNELFHMISPTFSGWSDLLWGRETDRKLSTQCTKVRYEVPNKVGVQLGGS